uniref:Elicitin n=1 Tax=Hyaloperonospora arabidopsidis TaxID=272952 RepID=F6MEX4_HYAAB|nr:elicitin-like protein [Hyaloperonospora arabidopsidis]
MFKYFAITTTILALVAPARGANADAGEDDKCGMIDTFRMGSNIGQVFQKSGNIALCASVTDFNMLTASVLPDAATMAKMCKDSACRSSIGSLEEFDLPDCTLHVPLVSANLNFARLVKQFQTTCTDSSTSDSASNSTSDSGSASTSTSDSGSASTSTSDSTSNSDEDDDSDEDEDEDEDK